MGRNTHLSQGSVFLPGVGQCRQTIIGVGEDGEEILVLLTAVIDLPHPGVGPSETQGSERVDGSRGVNTSKVGDFLKLV